MTAPPQPDPQPADQPRPQTPPTPPLTPAAQAAYSTLYAHAYGAVVAVLSRSVRASDAEDLAQSAFLKVYCNWSTIADRSPEAQRAYVLQAARNMLRDAQRRTYAFPGGQPTSLDRLWVHHDGSDLSSLSDHSATISHLLTSADPRDDPELHYLLRESLGEALGAPAGTTGVPQTLAALEILLLADGCESAEVVRRLRRAAQMLPTDPDASYFRTITVSALKGRLLRRRAKQRTQPTQPTSGQPRLPSTRAASRTLRRRQPPREEHPHAPPSRPHPQQP